jgi:hypothetical protein
MWLASLRRLFFVKSKNLGTKKDRSQKRRVFLTLDFLEDRIVPSTLNVDAGDVNNATPPAGYYSLVGAISQANTDSTNGIADTISLATNSTYTFTATNNNTTNGANVLPVITAKSLTILGNGSTLNAASFGRLFDVASGAGVTIDNLTLTGGSESGATAQGGAIFNNGGNLTLKTDVVGGNQVVGGANQNGQGGAIYSNGGTLTLVKDIIGKKVTNYYNASLAVTKHSTFGNSNKATGGVGGSGQGAGLYVTGGTVNVTSCTFGANYATGGSAPTGGTGGSGQGGAIYSSAASLDLNKSFVGIKVTHHLNSSNVQTKQTSIGVANSVKGGSGGGSVQGIGLFVNGGTVKVTNCTISGNGGFAGNGGTGGAGGNALGGGIYSSGATLTVSGGSFENNYLISGNGGTGVAGTVNHLNGGGGGAGGNAQGAGIYAKGGSLTVTNGANISSNGDLAASGGSGGAAYTGGVGGAGGAGGAAEGGSIYASQLTSPLVINGGSKLSTNSVLGGNGGSGKLGGAGGQGGLAAGGAVFATQTAVQINGGAVLNTNQVNAGGGGTGSAGGAGGAGGAAKGGGLYSDGGIVTLTGNAQFNSNKLFSGVGGNGGAGVAGTPNGGVGGNSGAVEGGGVYAVGGNVTMSTVQVQQNSIVANVAGKGGNGASNAAVNGVGGAGGAGGMGGAQIGSGLYVSGSNLTVSITSVSLSYNLEGPTSAYGGAGGVGGAAANGTGGAGGAAGNDGNTEGGGAAFFGSNTVTLNGITSVSNVIIADSPGYGGSGGVGLVGGAGGNAGNAGVVQGGGIFAGGGNLTINGGSVIENNKASGQTGGKGGRAGKSTNNTAKTVVHIGTGGAGSGSQGGGVAATGATVTLDKATISANYSVGGEGGTGGAYTNYEKTNLSLYNSGVNGPGGFAQGGGLYASMGSLTIQNRTAITNNVAQGAYGGPTLSYGQLQSAGFTPITAAPGVAQGAGVAIVNMTSAVTFTNSTIDSNVLETTDGGNGNPYTINNNPLFGVYPLNGVNGLNNGIAQGAGLFVQNSTFNGTSATITNNGIRVGDGGNGATPPSSNTKVHTGGNGGNGGGVNTAQGGGLYATGSTITLTSSTLVGNSLSVDSGGNAGVGNSGKPNGLAGAGGSGGVGEGAGLYADSGSSVTMLSSSVSNNVATIGFGGNGALGGAGGAGGNDGSGLGGGVYVNGTSTLKVTNSTLASNVVKVDFGGNGSGSGAGGAGGVGTSATTSGTAQGGGLFAGASTLTLINDTLAANTLDVAFGGNGGAAGVGGAGGVNNGIGQGGGLYLTGGTATVINNTIADNTLAVNQGGAGITAGTSGTTYTAQAGGLYDNPNSTDTVTLENTIVALDTVFSSSNDILGTIASSDHDFIGNGSGATFTSSSGDQIGTSTSPLNPNLGPLANYGGPTLTMLANSGSAVLGAGDTGALTAIATAENTTTANATDQRGYARSVNNAIDIGADEDQLGLSISGTVTPSNVQAGGDITYTFTVTNPNTFSVSGLTLTDVLPTNTTFVSLTAPSGWTTSTPTAGTTGTVSATSSSLAASSSATFTLVVQVNSTVASGTTIQNTATVATTQTGLQVSNSSVTLSTTVGTPVNIITSEVAIFRSPIIPDFDDGKGNYFQLLLLINKTRTTITGPVALVLTNLTSGVTLTNASGTYNGNPYINIVSSNGSWKPGWWNLLFVTLEFSDPNGVPITYTPEIVQGL